VEDDPLARRPAAVGRPQGGGGGNRGGGGGGKDTAALKELAQTMDETEFVPATVTSIQNFGAFVKLEQGVEGLVHISQIKEGFLAAVSDEVAVGDEVQVRIVSIDMAKGQLKLSMLPYKERSEWDDEDSDGDYGGSAEDKPLTEEQQQALQALMSEANGPEEETSWLDIAMSAEEDRKGKKAKKEKYTPGVTAERSSSDFSKKIKTEGYWG
jgi:predicted RNA-binding protein with RPS1 domain